MINKKLFFDILANIDNLSIIEPKCDVKTMKIFFYQAIKNLVDCGCLKYKKLSCNNYYYWWYEVNFVECKPNKNIFTAKLQDFMITRKGINILAIFNSAYAKDYNYDSLCKVINLYDYLCSQEIPKNEFIDILAYRNNAELDDNKYNNNFNKQIDLF